MLMTADAVTHVGCRGSLELRYCWTWASLDAFGADPGVRSVRGAAYSPGGFGARVETSLSAIHRIRLGFFRYYAPTIRLVIGDGGRFGGIFDLVPMIGTFASVESETVER